MYLNFSNNLQLSHIFIFILLIAVDFLKQLFPCHFANDLNDNMFLKHTFGLLTMTFLVILASPDYNKKLSHVLLLSIKLYIFFLLLVKTNYTIFYSIIILLGVLYLISIYENETPDVSQDKLNLTKDIITIVILFFLVIGFLSYMGLKRKEYGKHFNYITFVLGKPNCANTKIQHSVFHGLKHLFHKCN